MGLEYELSILSHEVGREHPEAGLLPQLLQVLDARDEIVGTDGHRGVADPVVGLGDQLRLAVGRRDLRGLQPLVDREKGAASIEQQELSPRRLQLLQEAGAPRQAPLADLLMLAAADVDVAGIVDVVDEGEFSGDLFFAADSPETGGEDAEQDADGDEGSLASAA